MPVIAELERVNDQVPAGEKNEKSAAEVGCSPSGEVKPPPLQEVLAPEVDASKSDDSWEEVSANEDEATTTDTSINSSEGSDGLALAADSEDDEYDMSEEESNEEEESTTAESSLSELSSVSILDKSEFPSSVESVGENDGLYFNRNNMCAQSEDTDSDSDSNISHISQTDSNESMIGSETSESEVSDFVARMNKININKTLHGVADIISNWSLKTDKNGEESCVLLHGNPLPYVAKIHNARIMVETQSSAPASVASSPTPLSCTINPNATEESYPQNHGGHHQPPQDTKDGKLYHCGYCGLYFLNKIYWNYHVIHYHYTKMRENKKTVDETKTFECPHCFKVFGQKRSRNAHQKTHDD